MNEILVSDFVPFNTIKNPGFHHLPEVAKSGHKFKSEKYILKSWEPSGNRK